jgi:hypothetical protein
MRDLPLLDADGSVREDAPVVALTYMRWPEDPRSADDRAVALANDAFRGVMSDFAKETWRRVLESERSGIIAGGVFLRMLSFGIHYPQAKVSRNRVIYLYSQEAGAGHEANVEKHWNEYKNVAHFWAAVSSTYTGKADSPAGGRDLAGHLRVDVDQRRVAHLGLRESDPPGLQHIETILSTGQAALERFEELDLGRQLKDWNPWQLPPAFPRVACSLQIPKPPPEWLDIEYAAAKRAK